MKGTFDSGAGQALKMVMHCEAYDASGKLLATSEEHIYQLSIHELMDYVQPMAIDNPSQIATMKVIADVSLWVYGTDEEK